MNLQEKKEFLQSYQIILKSVQQKQSERQKWRELATKVTPSYTSAPFGTDVSDKIQYCVSMMDEIDQALWKDIQELVSLRKSIYHMIHSVSDIKLQLILNRKYVDGLTLEKIADEMCYDVSWIKVLLKRALNLIVPVNSPQMHDTIKIG